MVSYSDDEKCIKKAEKEAQREIEKKVASRKNKGKSNGSYRHRRASPNPSDQPGPSHRWDMGQMGYGADANSTTLTNQAKGARALFPV